MRFRFKVITGVIIGFVVTLLIIHWELQTIHWQWSRNFVPKLHDGKEAKIDLQQTADKYKAGYFQKLVQDTYIYSAFIELQSRRVIRLVVLSGKHYQPKIICHFCNNRVASCRCPSQLATYYTNNENHGRAYGGFIASCTVPECFDINSYFAYLTVDGERETNEQLRIPLVWTADSIRHEYSICTPPLRGQGTKFLNQLTEFIELTMILGATHFTFYDFKIDGQVKQLLSYYEERGMVTVLPWNLPDYMTTNVNQLWYHGQVLAIQDCLYRSKGRSKFVAFNDIDEFIVPLKHPTVPFLLHAIHSLEQSGHCFDNVIFSLNARVPGAQHTKASKLNSLRIYHRTSERLPSWSKCIVDPQQVFEMGIHHISKAKTQQLTMNRVDEKLGLLFHYRKCSSAYGIGQVCGHLIPDYTMQRFTNKLQHNVDIVLKHIQR